MPSREREIRAEIPSSSVSPMQPVTKGVHPLKKAIQSGARAKSYRTALPSGPNRRGAKRIAKIAEGGKGSMFIPPVCVVGSKGPVKGLKELAENFYHRSLCRRIFKSLRSQIARSKHVQALARESYPWHVYRYYTSIWYHNVLIVTRIAEKRGDCSTLRRRLWGWEKYARVRKSLKEMAETVKKQHDVQVGKIALKKLKRSFLDSISLKARLRQFRIIKRRGQCQRAFLFWRLWGNIRMTRRVAAKRMMFLFRCRMMRSCLIGWHDVVQSSKLLMNVFTKATACSGVANVERTLEKTFILLMRVLHSWKRVLFEKKQRGAHRRAFLLWYMVARNERIKCEGGEASRAQESVGAPGRALPADPRARSAGEQLGLGPNQLRGVDVPTVEEAEEDRQEREEVPGPEEGDGVREPREGEGGEVATEAIHGGEEENDHCGEEEGREVGGGVEEGRGPSPRPSQETLPLPHELEATSDGSTHGKARQSARGGPEPKRECQETVQQDRDGAWKVRRGPAVAHFTKLTIQETMEELRLRKSLMKDFQVASFVLGVPQ